MTKVDQWVAKLRAATFMFIKNIPNEKSGEYMDRYEVQQTHLLT
jgi:hypothetical protein